MKSKKSTKPNTLDFVLNNSSKVGGFTLIEVLVYGAIFSLFLLLITQVFLTIKMTSANSLAMINLQQNYVRLFSDLNQTLRSAESVFSPSAGSSAETLSLNDGAIVYQVSAGVLEKVVNGSVLVLTDKGVSVSAISFENVGEATQTASLKIQIKLDSNYLLEGGRTVSEELLTTINLR